MSFSLPLKICFAIIDFMGFAKQWDYWLKSGRMTLWSVVTPGFEDSYSHYLLKALNKATLFPAVECTPLLYSVSLFPSECLRGEKGSVIVPPFSILT